MEQYQLKIPSHYNLYTSQNNREIEIQFILPDEINEQTGIFIFVPGFGGHINSKVYKKLREQLANKYNVVTLQCDYFGSQFMQNEVEFILKEPIEEVKNKFPEEAQTIIEGNPSEILRFIANSFISYRVDAKHEESLENFVDLGYMQALDILTAIESLKMILKDDNLIIDERRVYGFGQSHGAYLLHLVNRMAPHLFERIIDMAAWVKPVYLEHSRYTNDFLGICTFEVEHDYIARKVIKDKDALSLHHIYKNFKNGAQIYSAIGTTDNLVAVEDKQQALSNLEHVFFDVIDASRVDGEIFKSTDHGMDSDFFKVIDSVWSQLPDHRNPHEQLLENHIILNETPLKVDYSQGVPIVYIE